jgi:hypothetical protein
LHHQGTLESLATTSIYGNVNEFLLKYFKKLIDTSLFFKASEKITLRAIIGSNPGK